MSLERDLLGRWHNGDLLPEEYMKLMKETKELLAQPEQEPVAWMQDSIELYVQEEKSTIRGYVIPLYTAPPKREPLSVEDIGKGFLLTDVWHRYECFIAGVKWAERQHGIGGGKNEN